MLSDLLGERGIIDMGIRKGAIVEEAVLITRRRRHRAGILNDIENDLNNIKETMCTTEEDASLWKRKSGFKHKFSTHETWSLLRENRTVCGWARGIWYAQATPKFAFISWLAMLGRLSTMNRVARWNQGVYTTCVLCKNAQESRDHLFFECSFSSQIWEHLSKGILRNSYTNVWSALVPLLTDDNMDKTTLFCFRYAFQATLYAIWR